MLNKQNHESTRLKKGVNTLIAVLAFTGFSATTIPANANEFDSNKVSVTIDGRDLATEHGSIEVYNHLAYKAKRACGHSNGVSLQQRRLAKTCTKRLLNDFVMDLNNPMVTEHHERQIAQ